MTSAPFPLQAVFDEKTKTNYEIGRFLGKGGFAKCYEFRNVRNKHVYAGKVVSKAMLTKDQQKEKMSQEIIIHRTLCHRHIVTFHSHFEDSKNVYIILELCRKRSFMEMHKRRKMLTENEVRYFVHQIVAACIYLHENKVVHRDLKLGNLFITDDMNVKVGDFGLATRIEFEGERKKTVCGTPNYIAPEILTKSGHSFEADVWSLGCIMYTLLVGMPPFETKTLKETYSKIKRNEYYIPSKIGKHARLLIQKMLRIEPSERPTMSEILTDDFFMFGYFPSRLPTSCLTMAPRFSSKCNRDMSDINNRKPLLEIKPENFPTKDITMTKLEECLPKDNAENAENGINIPEDYYLNDMYQLLKPAITNRPNTPKDMHDEALDPAAIPFLWISKWVDYTDKYGLGYQLCDNSIGVLFNDFTRLIVFADGRNFNYIDRNGDAVFHTFPNHPQYLNKKVKLMHYFQSYMADNLLKAGESVVPKDSDEFTQLPYLRAWFRTKMAIVFHMTNGTLQINFFDDHTKIILCPVMGAVSFIDENKNFLVYKLNLIETFGCSSSLFDRLKYAKLMLERLASSDVASGKLKKEAGTKVSPKRKM